MHFYAKIVFFSLNEHHVCFQTCLVYSSKIKQITQADRHRLFRVVLKCISHAAGLVSASWLLYALKRDEETLNRGKVRTV